MKGFAWLLTTVASIFAVGNCTAGEVLTADPVCNGARWVGPAERGAGANAVVEVGAGVYNGDVGVIVGLDRAAGQLTVRYDDRDAVYELDQLGELEHAFAMTVHKSQGSEYDAVILPLWTVPARLCSRNLLYTAVTRAKRLLVIVGSSEVLAEMARTNSAHKRYGALRQRIRALCR